MKKDSNVRIRFSTDNRITIPREICNSMKLKAGTEFYVECEDNKIILSKVNKNCEICGKPTDHLYVHPKGFKGYVCNECAKKMGLEEYCSVKGIVKPGDKIFIPRRLCEDRFIIFSYVKKIEEEGNNEVIYVHADEQDPAAIRSGRLDPREYNRTWFTDEEEAKRRLANL